jgi:AraC-like DNA-binding protein
MQNEKPFLDPQLTLADLARQNGVNSTVLSHIINTGFDKNFNDFVNEYRINEVIKKLQNGGAENSTLLSTAFDCGFNSKATFNRAFKKVTGNTPKEYIEKSIFNEADKINMKNKQLS